MSTWLGIDVGRSAVKVAVIRSTYRKMALVGMGSAEVPADGGNPSEAIRAAVLAALGGGRIAAGDSVATSVPGEKAAIRNLGLPASAQKQIAEVLQFELEAQVPFEMEGSIFDWRILQAGRKPDQPDQLQILAAIARIDDVRERIDLVKTATAHEPERVSVGGLPLANLVALIPAMAEEAPVCVLDLGVKSSELLIMRGGEPVFARTMSLGTQGLPQTVTKLTREIRLSINAYRAAGGEAPLKVLLCGGGSFVTNATSFLTAELGMPVEVLPAPQLDLTGISAERVQELPRYAKAMGLAMGLSGRALGLNLRKGPLVYERGYAWVREKIPMLAGLAAVILVSFVFSAWARLYALGKEKATLQKALAVVTKDVLGEETEDPARARELLEGQIFKDDDPMPHADAFDVMVRISEAIPQSMKHDIESLDVQKGHVIIRGIVGSIPDAHSIESSLKSERCFQNVKISRTDQAVGGERHKYVMELDLKCPEDDKDPKKPAAGAPSASASGGK